MITTPVTAISSLESPPLVKSPLSPAEYTLIARIKETQDSEALVQLINMHTGIYYMIAGRYCRTYPDVIKMDDMRDDQMTNMYRWIIEYKPERSNGKGLGQYIGDQTDYHCKHTLQKERLNPLSPYVAGSLPSGDGGGVNLYTTGPSFGSDTDRNMTYMSNDDLHTTIPGVVASIQDTSTAAPQEEAAKQVALQDIRDIIDGSDSTLDPRFRAIVELRHFNTPQLTWRSIGQRLSISHERARTIYNRGMEIVKAKVMTRVAGNP